MNNSILVDLLHKSKDRNEIICVWTYKDDDGFWAGHIQNLNEELFVMKHYTKYGKPDGVIIDRIANIKSVDFEDDYTKALNYIIENSSALDKENEFKLSLSDDNWQLDLLKQVEGEGDCFVEVEINGDDNYSGFVLIVSETDFVLNCVGKLGENEGKVIFKIEDVSSIRINDLESRKRKMLYNWRKS